MSTAAAELERYVQTVQKYLQSATDLISDPSPDKDELELHLSIFERYIPKIEKFRPARNAKDEVEFVEKAIPTLDNTFITQVQLERIIRKIEKNSTSIRESQSESTSEIGLQQTNSFSLPRMNIQKFDGSQRQQYIRFRASFKAIFEPAKLDNTSMFLRLTQYLTGKALKHIEHLPIDDSSYNKAMEILDKQYDDRDAVIAELYKEIHNLPPIQGEATERLRNHFDKIESILRALEQYGERINQNSYLHNQIYQKFPANLIYTLSPTEKLTLQEFRERMEKLLRVRENHSAMNTSLVVQTPRLNSAVSALSITTPKARKEFKRPVTCSFCKNNHFSDKCGIYTTHEDRKKKIPNRCFVCLYDNHTTENCRSPRKCFYCREKHHSSLCPTKFPQAVINNSTKKDESNASTNLFVDNKGTYLTASGVQIRNRENGLIMNVRTIIDPGCPTTLLTDMNADLMQLQRSSMQQVPVKGFLDEVPKILETAKVTFEIILPQTNESKLIVANTTPFVAKEIYSIKPQEFLSSYPQYEQMNFAKIDNNEEPTLLLGADYTFTFLADEPKVTVGEDLHLIHSKFGWMIAGPVSSLGETHPQSYLLTTSSALDKLWSLDTVGIKDTHVTEDEEKALNQFYETISFENGRYKVGWPWRIDPETLPTNFGLSLGRLRSLHKKLSSHLIQVYDDILKEQLQSGIIEEVDSIERQSGTHYLPHHAVLMPEKSTPLRIVHDGSAKTNPMAKSLNEAIYKGVPLLQNMVMILIRFRFYLIALIADIEKAYHMISLNEEDRDMVRFIWLKDISKPPELDNIRIFRFCRFPFGIIASPFVLAATIRHHLQQNLTEFDDRLLHDFYVDNLTTGTSNEDEAIKLVNLSIETFKKCNMNLRKWATTSEKVRSQIPIQLRATDIEVSLFGLQWNSHRDTISLARPKLFDGFCTLKSILQSSSKVYDPLGFFAPIILKAKFIMRQLREQNFNWNDVIEDKEITSEWASIYKDLAQVHELQLPRRVPFSAETEIHCFSDASAKGYGFVIYSRTRTQNNIEVHFLFAKARICPPKKLTIPKLELLAASLAARAVQFVLEAVKPIFIPKAVILWTDSKCTLARIYTSKILPVYEENRVKEIRKVTNLNSRYVPSSQNPADIASRGATWEELQQSIWFTGPKFLQLQESAWPAFNRNEFTTFKIENKNPESTSVLNIVNAPQKEAFTLESRKFNSLRKLLRVTNVCFQFIAMKSSKFRQKMGIKPKPSLHFALMYWLRRIQEDHFADIISDLQKNNVSKNPLIRKLNLTLHTDGIIRCTGRFACAPTSIVGTLPILLPAAKDEHFVKILIWNYHELNFHVGTNQTLAAIRRSYWILQGRRSVYSTLKACKKCIRYCTKPYKQPDFSILPEIRLTKYSVPFQYVGMDTIGPIIVNSSKRWILLITCMVVRAVVLEPLSSLNATDLSLALRRFHARRNSPSKYFSDNAPQFILLEGIIKDTSIKEVEWSYIPPKASWMGGMYERLVSPVKQALYRTYHNQKLDEELFRTTILEIESTINDRPLTYVDTNDELQPLRPNDFLSTRYEVSNVSSAVFPSDSIPRKTILLMRGQAENCLSIFWKKWATSYLQELRDRHSRDQVKHPLKTATIRPKIGQVVLLEDSLRNRSTWNMGKVIEIQVSKSDGEIRSATVQTGNRQILTRAVSHLYPLELEEYEPLPEESNSSERATTEHRTTQGTQEEFEIESIEVEIQDESSESNA